MTTSTATITVHGTTYHTAVQAAARITELTYLNRIHGESDGRVTELDDLFTAMEDLAASMLNDPSSPRPGQPSPAQRMVATVLSTQKYLLAS